MDKLNEAEVLVRCALPSDLEDIFWVESQCFPPAEAAARSALQKRLEVYPSHCLLLFSGKKLAAFVNGAVTCGRDLQDFMFADASVHDEGGDWQMVFGLCTAPAFRKRGFAAYLLRLFIAHAKEQGRRGVVLTCKPPLVSYYSRFGFEDEGVCSSVHGGEVWHQVRLTF